jgi:uncharacterized damage-inducible protein DinB
MKEQLSATLQNSRTYTLAVAEAMPADAWNFKPKGTGWNFRELLHHIAYGIQWWEANYVKGVETPWNPPPAKNNKQEVIDYLNQAYDAFTETVNKQKLTDKAVQGFHATIDHITHHRGQAVIYLRSNGITPPEYTY